MKPLQLHEIIFRYCSLNSEGTEILLLIAPSTCPLRAQVFDDANLELAVNGAMTAKFRFGGQVSSFGALPLGTESPTKLIPRVQP